MFSPKRLLDWGSKTSSRKQSTADESVASGVADVKVAAVSSSGFDAEDNRVQSNSCSISSLTDPTPADWWKQKYYETCAQVDQLQLMLDTRSRTNRGGLGKNTQTHYRTAACNRTNKTALMNWVQDWLWPRYKLLFFKGRWTTYEAKKPHNFAAKVMTAVRMPKAFIGHEKEYYEQFALPVVNAKLSNMRGNYVTQCKNAFKRECVLFLFLSAFFVFGATRHLTQLFTSGLYRTCDDFRGVGASFELLLSFTNTNDGGWDALLQPRSPEVVQLCNLVYHYASEVYGRTRIKNWLKANQDKSVLDIMTASDLAFAAIVFQNYFPRWIDDLQADNDADAEDEEKQVNDDNEKDGEEPEPPQKKRKTSELQLKYTKKQGQKKRYLEDDWTSEGKNRLTHLQCMFKELMQHEVAWQACKDGWDKYIADMKRNGVRCWVPTYRREEEEDYHSDVGSVCEDEGFDFEEDSEGIDLSDVNLPPPVLPSPEELISADGNILGV